MERKSSATISEVLTCACEQDEEAELLAELERIKKERAEEAAKKQLEEAATKEKEVRDELLRGNPLVNSAQAPAFQVTSFSCSSNIELD